MLVKPRSWLLIIAITAVIYMAGGVGLIALTGEPLGVLAGVTLVTATDILMVIMIRRSLRKGTKDGEPQERMGQET